MGCGASTGNSAKPAADAPPKPRLMELTDERHQMLKDAFEVMDADKDGSLDLDEFTKSAAGIEGHDVNKITTLFNFFDSAGDDKRMGRGDGKLTFDEWVVGMRRLYVNRDMTDEQFVNEMKEIVSLGKAMQQPASS